MTDEEALYRMETLFAKMFDRVDNVEARIASLEKEFIEYAEHDPIADEQWAEERLRALEIQMLKVITRGIEQ